MTFGGTLAGLLVARAAGARAEPVVVLGQSVALEERPD
jgi:hypothetical protein